MSSSRRVVVPMVVVVAVVVVGGCLSYPTHSLEKKQRFCKNDLPV